MTPKQERFILEYVKEPCATRAAIRAGYKPRRAGEVGYQLLQKTPISEAIKKLQDALARRLEISAERVLREYAKIAFCNMDDFLSWGPKGVRLKPLDGVDLAAVQELSTSENGTVEFCRIKLHNKLKALDALAKHLGLFDQPPVDAVELLLAKLPRDLAAAIRAAMVKAQAHPNPAMVEIGSRRPGTKVLPFPGKKYETPRCPHCGGDLTADQITLETGEKADG